MTKHAIRFQARLNKIVRNDSGQGALEYVGMLIVVALVAAAAITILNEAAPQVTEAVTTAVSQFLTGS